MVHIFYVIISPLVRSLYCLKPILISSKISQKLNFPLAYSRQDQVSVEKCLQFASCISSLKLSKT